MAATSTRDLGTGLFVLLGFAALAFLLTQTTDIDEYRGDSGYRVVARFQDIAGLKVRAPVTMAGVNIGRVEKIEFDGDRLDALVTMRIENRYDRIPDDSDAAVLTAGLLGSKYIGIGPGGSDTFLKESSEIQLTQSAIVLEKLVSKFLFSQGENNGGAKDDAGGSP